VTLVSPEPVLQIRPRLLRGEPETLGVDLLPLLRKVDVAFVRGEAVELDTAAKAVTLAAGDRLAYDRLVIATAAGMRRPPVLGAETAFSVDTKAEAIAFDRRLGEIARDVAQPTIAVVAPASPASSSRSSCATGCWRTAPMVWPSDCASC